MPNLITKLIAIFYLSYYPIVIIRKIYDKQKTKRKTYYKQKNEERKKVRLFKDIKLTEKQKKIVMILTMTNDDMSAEELWDKTMELANKNQEKEESALELTERLEQILLPFIKTGHYQQIKALALKALKEKQTVSLDLIEAMCKCNYSNPKRLVDALERMMVIL